MERRYETMQELVGSLGERGENTCLLWFEETGADSLTYAQFAALARDIARGLAERGLGPKSRVALFAENSWRIAALAAGTLLAGATAVPLDPQFTGEILRHVLTDASPALLLASGPQEQAVRDALGELDIPLLLTDEDEGERSWRTLTRGPGDDPGKAIPEGVAALFYTSGSTGRPKGVPLTHANLVFQQQALIQTGLTVPGDRVLLPLPLHHVYPFVVGLFAPLAMGLCVIFPRAIAGAELIRAVHEGQATIMAGIPRLYEVLATGVMERMRSLGFFGSRAALALLALSRFARSKLGLRLGKTLFHSLHARIGRDLRVMASGGAPLEADLALTLEALGWRTAIGYGLTETSPILCLNPPGDGRLDSVGPPLQGVELRVVLSDGRFAPDGAPETGEVQARGPGVFSGYRNLPDATREAFTADGWFRTGDLGRLEAGRLMLSGRASTLIVTGGGENVQPDAVEQVLDRHLLIKESGVLEVKGKMAVLVRPDLVAARNAGLEPFEAARRGVREASQKLPSYQRPVMTAVTANAIERTRLGKIRRHLLKAHFERALEGGADEDLRPMPPGEMQTADRRLFENPAAAAAWEILCARYPGRRLTPDSDLAGDVGVDSLEWLDLSLELGGRTGVDLDEEEIASIATVRDLLRAMSRAREERAGQADPVARPEEYLSEEDAPWLTPVSGWRLALYRFLHATAGGAARVIFRIKTHGLERLPEDAAVVLAPNHASYLDPILLASGLPFSLLRRTHFIGWQGAAFANRVVAFISRTAQGIPIDPARRPGASLALGAAVLAHGRNLVWFPEGMRSTDGNFVRFQPGLGRILLGRRAMVAPVRIFGSYEALPPGRWWIKPVRVTIVIGEPAAAETLLQEGQGETPAERVMQGLRRRMEGLGDGA